MCFTTSQFEYLKKLSKLDFSPNEEARMRAELETFINYLDVIRSYDFGAIPNISENSASFINAKVEERSYAPISYTKPSRTRVTSDIYNIFMDEPDLSLGDKSIAVKDNILIKGMKATAGSNMLRDYVATYDADVITKLKAAGYTFAGKTNMDEFAMGFDSSTSYKGRVLNPLDTNRSAGGSSGGSAAAVAAGLTKLALGSDTGGSILQPASYMGLVGLRCAGTVSRQGLISYASSIDTIGPITTNVDDCMTIYKTICDEEFIPSEPQTEATSGINPGDCEIWVPDNLLALSANKDVILNAAYNLGGGKVVHFDMPFIDELVASYYVVTCALASSNLARYDEDRYMSRDEGFGFEVKKRILLGNFVLSHGFYDDYFRKAYEIRKAVTGIVNEIASGNRYIVMPVTKTTAPLITELDAPLRKYTDDVFTCWADKAITVPCGNDEVGLPVGLQIVSSNISGMLGLAKHIEDMVGGFF